jgi:hypothetical protein
VANVDLPDLALLEERCPGISTITLKAGLQLSLLPLLLAPLSRLAANLAGDLTGLGRRFSGIATHLEPFAPAAGAIDLIVTGERAGRRVTRHFTMVAAERSWPYIPASVSALLTKRLMNQPGYAPLDACGAGPCVGLIGIEEWMNDLAGRAVRTIRYEH